MKQDRFHCCTFGVALNYIFSYIFIPISVYATKSSRPVRESTTKLVSTILKRRRRENTTRNGDNEAHDTSKNPEMHVHEDRLRVGRKR